MDPLIMAQMGAQVAEPVQQTSAFAIALWTPFHDFVTGLTNKLDAGQDAVLSAEIAWLVPIAKVLATISIIWVGLGLAYGVAEARTIVRTFTRWAVVFALIANVPTFQQWIVQPLTSLPTDFGGILANAMGGKPFAGDGSPFDIALSSSWRATLVTFEALPWLSLKSVFLSLLLWGGFLLSCATIAVAFLVWITAKLSLTVLLYVSPVFIVAFGSEATRQWASNWLAACMAAATTQVLAILVLVVQGFAAQATTDPIVAAYVGGGGGENVVTQTQAILINGIASFCLAIYLWQIPGLAGSLFHGFSAGANRFASGISNAAAWTGSTYSAGRNAASWAASATRRGT